MKNLTALSLAAVAGIWMWRKGTTNSGPSQVTPGEPKQFKSRALELGATLLQAKSPLQAMNIYLDGFHVYSGDLGRQVEAHHYCAQINEDFYQCVIFDGNTPDARLMGVEYIVSERLFNTLPDEEKRLWHSHHYEVKSGTTIAPGLPEVAEHELMKNIITTYGKTWNTWDCQRDPLPLGIPVLMSAFTQDGQLHEELVEDRDRRFQISTAERRVGRADISTPQPHPLANAWISGWSPQLELSERQVAFR